MATILHVDDEPAIGLILQDTLSAPVIGAVSAGNVLEALQALARGTVDLIISDYRMPGLTGLEFLPLLRQEGYETPLIMLTGYAQHRARGRGDQGRRDRLHHEAGPPAAARARGQSGARVRAPAARERTAAPRGDGVPERAPDHRRQPGDSTRPADGRDGRADARDGAARRANRAPARSCSRARSTMQSDRRDGPFIKLNCAALPEGSGRERAVRPREGRVHRRDQARRRRVRASERRNAAARRNLGDAARSSGEAAARAAGAGVRARRRHRRRSRSTCASSRRRTATSPPKRRRVISGRTSTID